MLTNSEWCKHVLLEWKVNVEGFGRPFDCFDTPTFPRQPDINGDECLLLLESMVLELGGFNVVATWSKSDSVDAALIADFDGTLQDGVETHGKLTAAEESLRESCLHVTQRLTGRRPCRSSCSKACTKHARRSGTTSSTSSGCVPRTHSSCSHPDGSIRRRHGDSCLVRNAVNKMLRMLCNRSPSYHQLKNSDELELQPCLHEVPT